MKNYRTKEEYETAVKKSYSIASVCRYLGIKPKGGNYKSVHKAIETYNLDTSHFKGQGWNKGLKFKSSKDIQSILVENSFYGSYKLKNRLFKEDLKSQQCECCGLTEWNGTTIPLELHHINGDNRDNRLENLQILCPNCHAQTDNYRGKKKQKDADMLEWYTRGT